jgi:hypothetical protein
LEKRDQLQVKYLTEDKKAEENIENVAANFE